MHYLSRLITPKSLSLTSCWLLIATSLLSTASLADTRWYQVEIVIAQRNDAHLAQAKEQLAQTNTPITRGAKILADVPEIWLEKNAETALIIDETTAETALITDEATAFTPLLIDDATSYPAFTLLPETHQMLNQQSHKLNRSGLYDILFHKAWVQPFEQYGKPTLIDIVSEDSLFEAPKITGSIGIELKRFLHVHTHLTNRVQRNDLFDNPKPSQILVLPLEETIPDNLSTNRIGTHKIGTNNISTNNLSTNKINTGIKPFINYQIKRTNVTQSPWSEHEDIVRFTMQQSRKMRSRKLHYIDHPTLAVLVRFDPYDPETGAIIPES